MDSLFLDALPMLPQVLELRRLAQILWRQEGVIALWLGGGFARGVADQYSDLDLRLCVSVDSVEQWKQPDFELLFDGEIVGSRRNGFGPNQMFHQIVLANGYIIDLLVQTVDQKPPQDFVRLIGCRDQDFRRLLISVEPEPAYAPKPADRVIVCEIVTDFWINSLKTHKVLYRDLDAIALVGINLEHAVLMRLWHILATGNDTGVQRATIHGLTSIVRHIDTLLGNSAQELLGLPLRNRAELCHAVEANRNEVSRVGLILSERLDFQYPSRLENTVRTAWVDFLASSD